MCGCNTRLVNMAKHSNGIVISLSYVPLYVHLRPGYREKSADLQRTLKLYMQLYNRISRSQTPRNENSNANYSLHARSLATNASISQGEFTRDLSTYVFLASVAHPPQLLKEFACAVRYTHVYLTSK